MSSVRRVCVSPSMRHPNVNACAACVRVRLRGLRMRVHTVVMEEEERVGRDGGKVHLAADLVAPEVDRELVGREAPLQAVGQVLRAR